MCLAHSSRKPVQQEAPGTLRFIKVLVDHLYHQIIRHQLTWTFTKHTTDLNIHKTYNSISWHSLHPTHYFKLDQHFLSRRCSKLPWLKRKSCYTFLLQSILPNQLFLIKQYTKLSWSDCEFLHGAHVLSIIGVSIYISLAFRLYCYKKCAGLDCWGGPFARFTYYILLIVYTEELLSNVLCTKVYLHPWHPWLSSPALIQMTRQLSAYHLQYK